MDGAVGAGDPLLVGVAVAETGNSHPEPVIATIDTPHDQDFTALTIKSPGATSPVIVASLTATQHHASWDLTARQWTDAGSFKPGDEVRTVDGYSAEVLTVRNCHSAPRLAYNLTAADLHAYYALAGTTPILVHNDDSVPRRARDEIARIGAGQGTPRTQSLQDLTQKLYPGRKSSKHERKWGPDPNTGFQGLPDWEAPGKNGMYGIVGPNGHGGLRLYEHQVQIDRHCSWLLIRHGLDGMRVAFLVKYSVRFEEIGAYVFACDLEDFFVGRYSDDDFGVLLEAENARVTFRLVRPTLDASIGAFEGDIEVLVLGAEGRPMGRYTLWDAKLVGENSSEYLVITAQTGLPPHAEAGGLWDRFRISPPRLGEWSALQVGSREAWLEVAGLRYAESASAGERSAPLQKVVMRGAEIKDVASFFCAIGEAFRGPGGYVGGSFSDLEEHLGDYLHGAPVRLTWQNISVARSSLSTVMDFATGPISKFDLILDILSRNAVAVIPG